MGVLLQLVTLLFFFHYLNIKFYLRNGVISAEDNQILSKFALLESSLSILVMNNYVET